MNDKAPDDSKGGFRHDQLRGQRDRQTSRRDIPRPHPAYGRQKCEGCTPKIERASRLPLDSPSRRVGFCEKPKPEMDGMTRWKASSALPPWLVESVNGPMTPSSSKIKPGQRWVMIRGNAFSNHQPATARAAKICHVPGTPRNSASPRGSNAMPDPTTRSLTVCEAMISLAPAKPRRREAR